MKHISEFVRQCTDALSGDPEVQLEIEQELRDHLECRAAEEQSNGMSEEASEKLAIKAFGDAPEISESLYDTNLYRMKLHAKIRLFIKIAAIPALLVALYFSFNYKNMIFGWNMDSIVTDERFAFTHPDKLNNEQKLIVNGDTSKKNMVDQQKAIWERWPDNKMYLANYITTLMREFEKIDSKITQEYVLKELRKAESIDPQNAFYNYLATVVLLKNAVTLKTERIRLPGKQKKFEEKNTITVKNRSLLDCAMRELKKGIRKPYCKAYTVKMAILRADIVCDASNTLRDKIQRLTITASTVLPFLTPFRNIGRILPCYAKLLAEAGHKKEAEFYLNVWKPYVRQLNKGSETLIEALVANAIIGAQQKQIPKIYRMLKEPLEAQKAEEELKKATTVIANWKKSIKWSSKEQTNLKRKGGIFANLLLPALGEKITDEMLAPERHINYIMFEKILVAAMSIVGFMIIVLMMIFMGWNYWKGKRSFIFVPSLWEFTKIISWGIIVPLAVYYIITRISFLSGREYNLFFNVGLISIQSMWFVFGIPAAMVLMVSNFVRRRCRKTGIDVPPKSKWLTGILLASPIIAIFITCYLNLIAEEIFTPFNSAKPAITNIIMILIIIISPLFRLMFMKREFFRYKTALYVNMISPIILMMLTISVIVRPYLDREEIRLIKADKCMFSENGFTIIEKQAAEKLKNQLDQVLNKLPDKI